MITPEEAARLRDGATPGPWRADDEHGNWKSSKPSWTISRTDLETGSEFLGDIAYVPQDMAIPEGQPCPQEEADAHLIAAAPDLAETVATEPKRIAAAVAEAERRAWDEGYQACLRQWDRPANADRMPERNPYPAASVDRIADSVAAAERRGAAEVLLPIKRFAEAAAITARAQGHGEQERQWLDVLALIERGERS